MRKSGLVKQHLRILRPGTWSATEDVCPWGGQLMEIPGTLAIDGRSIKYRQQPDGVQLRSNQDTQQQKVSLNDLKINAHTFTNYGVRVFGRFLALPFYANRWSVQIRWRELLRSTLFHLIKRARSFEGVSRFATRSSDIDTFIRSYIEQNVIDRYELSAVNFFVKPVAFGPGRRDVADARFNPNVATKEHATTAFRQIQRDDTLTLIYVSPYDYRQFNLDYYYTLIFSKV